MRWLFGDEPLVDLNNNLLKLEANRSLRESDHAITDTDPSFSHTVTGGDTSNFKSNGTQGTPQLPTAASISCDPPKSPEATAIFSAQVSVTNHTLSEDDELYVIVTFRREIYEWNRDRRSTKFSLKPGQTHEETSEFRSLLPGEGYAMDCELRRDLTGPLFIGWPDESVATDRKTFSVGDFQSDDTTGSTYSVAEMTECSASASNLQVGATVRLQVRAETKDADSTLIAASFIQIFQDAKLVDSYPSVGSFFPYKKNERREKEIVVADLTTKGIDRTRLLDYTFTPSEPGLYTTYCFLHTGAVKGFTAKTRDENLTLNDYYKVLSLFLPGGGPAIDFWSEILSGYFSHLESVKSVHFCVGDPEDCEFYSTSDDESSGEPNLEVESLTVSKSAMEPGETFTLTASVRNSGSGESSKTTLRYYRSTTSTFFTSVMEDSVIGVSGLDPSGTERVSHPLAAPSDPGLYYYRTCVAPASGESDTDNNCSTGVLVTVEATQQGSPDLVVEAPSVSKNEIQPGGRFTLFATVRNIGDARAGSAILRYYRSTDSSISAGSDTEVGSDTVNSLQPSRTDGESVGVSAPEAPGEYYYGACVVRVTGGESDTGNNCSSGRRVTVAQATTNPDLVVDSPSVSQNEVDAGGRFTLRTTVRNSGDGPAPAATLRYYRSADSTITTGDAEVETDRVRYLDPLETDDESERLTAPDDAGAYYYGACVDWVTDESNTANNCSSGVRVTVEQTNPAAASAGDAATDRAALVALYNATGGRNWHNNGNWLSNAPMGEWHGITTDSDGRVTQLILDSNHLTGEIPAELGRLTSLEWLYLYNNRLTGEIPAELGSLSNLVRLYLNSNQLAGSIPAELGSLTNLGGLYLYNNQLTGAIPAELGSLSNLRGGLYLNSNQLTGSIPAELGDLSNLTHLLLNNNRLTGEIPAELGGLSNLTVLGLSGNRLTGEIPAELGDLSNLGWLRLNDNQLTGCIPAGLRNVPDNDLDELGLDDCASADDAATDRPALVAFYNATGGANWGNNGKWLSGAPMGEWHGVTTDSDGRVTHLNLYRNRLTGEIPAELGDLSNLRVLGLNSNQLTGEIPAELGSLPSLQSLWLQGNQLTGEIPAELGNLTNLTELYLDTNQLTGAIPAELGDLSNLRGLYLSSNQLTGEIPAELGNLTNLRWLYLNNNQLTGAIPAELGNLTHLYLNNNQLTGEISAELGNLTNLELLSLRTNQLTGAIPAELGNLTNLTHLYLSGNQLTGEIPAELGNLANLQTLHLYSNQLTGAIPAELGNLTNLQTLHLYSNQLTGAIPAELGNLTNLRWLLLSSNQLTGCIPEGLRNVATNDFSSLGLPFCMPSAGDAATDRAALVALYNATGGANWGNNGNWLSNAPMGEWHGVITDSDGRVTHLDLRTNQLTGEIPVELGNLTNLEGLDLYGNQLTGAIPAELGNLTNLTHLYLSGNQLTGEIPAELGNLANLQTLHLYSNQLTGEIPAELGSLPSLQSLWLQGNQLTGEIPAELGSLPSLQSLWLQGNQLTGEIPAELGSLPSLQSLWLQGNQLTGEIPAELGSLPSLQSLWLQGNQLTGEIPAELGSLPSLEVLDLRTN